MTRATWCRESILQFCEIGKTLLYQQNCVDVLPNLPIWLAIDVLVYSQVGLNGWKVLE